jgi:predicted RNA-binding Zn-ribbon protein involved in translation (DUF1610 family)
MDQLTHSLEDLGSPTCPKCGNEMQLYRSELVRFLPVTNLHFFNCPTCLLFAESETVHESAWLPAESVAAPRLRFFAPAA